jgi:hypothetical protein
MDNTTTVKLKIKRDDSPDSPREWDNMGTMVCWHRRYTLGDKKQPGGDPREWYAENITPDCVVLPLHLYDHSGISMQVGSFHDPWDSGQVGWIYATPEAIKENFMCEEITDEIRERATQVLQSEVKTYDQYLRGATWGYEAVKLVQCDQGHQHEEHLDSCWGFFGDNLEETGIPDSIPDEYKSMLEEAWDQRT